MLTRRQFARVSYDEEHQILCCCLSAKTRLTPPQKTNPTEEADKQRLTNNYANGGVDKTSVRNRKLTSANFGVTQCKW